MKPELKGSNFGRTWLKLVYRESSHKFLNVKTIMKVVSKRNNYTTLI
jgi:hypothetical protein